MDEAESAECPVSCITPESRELVELEARSRRYHSAGGACMFGPDSARWPAWWADTVNVLEVNRILEHNARLEAEKSEMSNR